MSRVQTIKAIQTGAQYEQARTLLLALVGTPPDSPEYESLESLLAEMRKYERLHIFSSPAKPTPLEIIRCVMTNRRLNPKDMQPFLGSRSQVSSVLSEKRPLTLSMIRALNRHLGIPLELLIGEDETTSNSSISIDWTRYPTKEVAAALRIAGKFDYKNDAQEIMAEACRMAGVACDKTLAACLRQGNRLSAKADTYATQAWLLCAKARARNAIPGTDFNQAEITTEFLRNIVQKSALPDGIDQALEVLRTKGIGHIYLSHFRRTYLDGAVFFVDGKPIIAQTCRYDRLDNFWFVLLHELAHLACGHLAEEDDYYLDDLDIEFTGQESEADAVALEAAIPGTEMGHTAFKSARIASIKSLARKLHIHDAIVAGRVRHDQKNYRILAQHVGQGLVRNQLEKLTNEA
ncbi:hypothetical protein [Desulfovibrio sp. TomC]|uniref:hypothetical protein n=1 Tax=Desulfovibrio sp. TomC TaxID=1562888 RepID=UPI000574B895|nr:hypothetical protein [Desulfovibrio sp. TomC]KHK00543.1 Helix-turn-helix motif [Desulfovibrio sp. TomC]